MKFYSGSMHRLMGEIVLARTPINLANRWLGLTSKRASPCLVPLERKMNLRSHMLDMVAF